MASFTVNQTSPIPGMTLTFADEFNGVVLPDAMHSDWTTTLPGNMRWLGVNNELQIYMDRDYRTPTGGTVDLSPFTTGDGTLTITAAPTPAALQPTLYQKYTSGMISSYDQHQFTFGYFEIRADLPAGRGLWPAFWLRSADSTVHSEIDILEFLGQQTNMPYQTIHADDGSTIKATRTKVPYDLSQGMHTFGVNWQPDTITFYVDGVQTSQVVTPASVKGPMYFIANMAVGGWAGPPDAATAWPAQVKIDYVHVFQSAEDLASRRVVGTAASEKLFGADGTDTIIGGGGNDTVLAGGGADSIDTSAGADRIVAGMGNDTLSGGTGLDSLLGGLGDDTYIINDIGDKIFEFATGGIDTVRTSLGTFSLPGNVENLVHVGSNAFVGTGNLMNNTITDGAGADTLFGGAGNDTLISTGGANKLDGGDGIDRIVSNGASDTLQGGAGADTFVFGTPTAGARATILDFHSGEDHLDGRGLGLTSFAAVTSHAVDTGSATVISVGGETITLNSVHLAQLQAGDFVF